MYDRSLSVDSIILVRAQLLRCHEVKCTFHVHRRTVRVLLQIERQHPHYYIPNKTARKPSKYKEIMISLGRLGRSASVVAGGPRYTLLQQPASLIGIRKAVSTSPAAAVTTAAKTVLVPSVPTEASARSFAGVGGNDRLLRPYVVKLATTSGQAAQFSSIRLAATRAFVSCSSDLSRYRPEEQGRLVAAESLPPLPSLLLPKLLHLQRQQRYNWGYQQQRGMMSAGNDGGGGAKGGAGGVCAT